MIIYLGLQLLHYFLPPCTFWAFEHISRIVIKISKREPFGAKNMAAISGANKRNRAQISAIGRKFRKEIWPIELTSISNRYGHFGNEQISKRATKCSN